jgi:5'-nucleotidase
MSPILKTFCLIASIFTAFKKECDVHLSLNISNYTYPTPRSDIDGSYRIAIFGTNDLHGAAFPLEITHPLTNLTYKYGGLEYLASYVKILREEWQERFLWLDGGDQFQGAIESKISNGSIITDFFNEMKVNASAIGNHEWDYGQSFLYNRLSSASWEYLAANIVKNSTNKPEFLPQTKVAKLVTVGKVKLGIIGLSTIETPFTTGGDLTDIKFLAYRDIIINYSNLLRSEGANAIILTTHVGMRCPNDIKEKMILKLRSADTKQAECNLEDEMNILLHSLDEGVVDAVVAGHIHDVAHHWVKGVPVIQNVNGGYYSHVMYLSFDQVTFKLQKEKIEVEGPLPSCEKVFSNTKRCGFVNKEQAVHAGELTKFTFHNKVIESDKSLDVLFQKWWEASKEYKVNIAWTDLLLTRGTAKENVLGNLVADSLKNKTNADIVVFNDGSLRSTWFPGHILVEHVWNMFPFDNSIVSFDMTGAEVKKMLTALQKGKKGFYHTAGVVQKVYTHPNELHEVKLYDGSEIIDEKTYKVSTNDFMLNGGDDFKDVLTFYTARNVTKFGSVRTQMINYIKAIAQVNEEDFIDPNHKRITMIARPTAERNGSNSFLKK